MAEVTYINLFDKGAGGLDISFPTAGGVLITNFNHTGGFKYCPQEYSWGQICKAAYDSESKTWDKEKFFKAMNAEDGVTGNWQDSKSPFIHLVNRVINDSYKDFIPETKTFTPKETEIKKLTY